MALITTLPSSATASNSSFEGALLLLKGERFSAGLGNVHPTSRTPPSIINDDKAIIAARTNAGFFISTSDLQQRLGSIADRAAPLQLHWLVARNRTIFVVLFLQGFTHLAVLAIQTESYRIPHLHTFDS